MAIKKSELYSSLWKGCDELRGNAQRALFDNLGENEELANRLDHKIKTTKKDGWKDHRIKTRQVFRLRR
ncbi:hypothetical protein QUF64_02080 [Anaerolineales bacterium HSG6]|nr:hypothetical protein [Anaerolineales bacterium HSG6]MDM8532819.1 hypothetical protein [Anaerolineales bacterium HSG25]